MTWYGTRTARIGIQWKLRPNQNAARAMWRRLPMRGGATLTTAVVMAAKATVEEKTRQELPFGIRSMAFNLARARALFFEARRTAKLAACLVRDDRVPVGPKLALGATLGLIVSPLNVPAWVPVVGDLDALALGALTVRVFVDACPEEVVEEQRARILRGESVFD